MINIYSSKKLLNQVTPAIREHWEKKNGISLSGSIAEIELIEDERMPDEDRIGTCRKAVKILSLTILSLFLTMRVLAYNYPHIRAVYPYTLGGLILIAMTAIVCIQIHQINLSNKLSDYRRDRINQQEILSGKVNLFWDTVLNVCERNTLPENKLINAEYLKDVLHVAIKDLLLKKAEYGARRKNTSINLNDTAQYALAYVSSDEYFNSQWEIIKDKLGVELNRKEMFKKAAEEMKKTHPGLSEFFETEEGQ